MPRGKQAKVTPVARPVDTPADSAQQDAAAAADIPSEVQGGVMDCGRSDSGAAEPSQTAAPATESIAAEEKRLQVAKERKKKVVHEMLDKSVEYGDYITKQLQIYQDKLESDLKQDIKPASKRCKAITTRTPTQLLVPLLNAELKDYQIVGVKWLISCWENGVNAILADEMGLGKTIQTLAFLSHLVSTGIYGPFMVVAPLSTLQNWEAEAKRFLPSQRLMVYHGTIAERKALQVQLKYKGDKPGPDFPIIVTSYEMLTRDRAQLCKIQFKCVIVDEGHRLKNTDCRLVQELRCFVAEFKLLLTGTPIQNNINELWSLLNFIMPAIFYNVEEFVKWFEFTGSVGQDGADKVWIDAEVDSNLLSKLHAILGPFMLRRLKSNVSLNLPLKLEIVLYAPMQPKQHEYTQLLREGKLQDHLTELADEQGCSDKIKPLNNFLMQLRKIANHTYLISNAADPYYPPAEVLEKDSGKLALLMRLLNKLRAEGHKVLVFSQMTGMLDIISHVLDCKGWKAGRLDGETPWQERQANINKFNTDAEMQVFLVSTRAGGLGINLTAADTVIIYDSDWNPHQDEQAMDRVHRIGQTKPVLVLRLATSHSVDSRMLKRAADKKTLERLVIKKDRFTGNHSEAAAKGVSEAELKELLQGTYQMNDLPQSQVVTDQVLNQLLDRVHLEKRTKLPYPPAGVGYEVVLSHDAKAAA